MRSCPLGGANCETKPQSLFSCVTTGKVQPDYFPLARTQLWRIVHVTRTSRGRVCVFAATLNYSPETPRPHKTPPSPRRWRRRLRHLISPANRRGVADVRVLSNVLRLCTSQRPLSQERVVVLTFTWTFFRSGICSPRTSIIKEQAAHSRYCAVPPRQQQPHLRRDPDMAMSGARGGGHSAETNLCSHGFKKNCTAPPTSCSASP